MNPIVFLIAIALGISGFFFNIAVGIVVSLVILVIAIWIIMSSDDEIFQVIISVICAPFFIGIGIEYFFNNTEHIQVAKTETKIEVRQVDKKWVDKQVFKEENSFDLVGWLNSKPFEK